MLSPAFRPFSATASCADLVAAAEATAGGDVLGQLTQEFVTCDDWTTIDVKKNKLKLVGGLPRYTLKRIRFAVDSNAVLRVEVPGPIEFEASFQGDDSQVGAQIDTLDLYTCNVWRKESFRRDWDTYPHLPFWRLVFVELLYIYYTKVLF